MREIHYREVVEITEEERIKKEETDRKNRRYLEIKPEKISLDESINFWDNLFGK